MNSGEFDYIIIGGGSAGCVLASRLSEERDLKILLIEAGGSDRNPLFHMPAGFAKMTKGIASWGWSTVPQKHLKDRVLWYTQAKVIGGGSTINAQVYTRGNRLDYDNWAQAGCTGWSYREVLPYFKRSEGNDSFDDVYHAKDGPLGVSRPRATLPICEAFFKAAEAVGIPFNPDFNGARQEGVGFYQLTQRNVSRSSTAGAFLKPALARTNLSLRQNVTVNRIVIEKNRAIGVEFAGDAGIEMVRAAREVILTAGAIGSPKLLMQSGIGPADHLSSVGVKPLLDLRGVGSNLQDHIDICVISECTGDHTYDKYAKPHWAAVAGLRYLLFRDGPVASSLFETGGFWYADKRASSPDIQFHLGLGSGIEAGIVKLDNPGVTLNSAFMRPRSRGTVRLAARDPIAAPLIDPNYWVDPYDREISFAGVRLAREIMRQDALKPYVMAERLPGPGVVSDDALFDYACRMAKTDHHPVGTCAMGTGIEAVVSPELKVHGIEALRICDASVMPFLVSSNTNAATMMIAEKASDMIRGRPPVPAAELAA
jgi:choline dehydrogenase-like flavoprotein